MQIYYASTFITTEYQAETMLMKNIEAQQIHMTISPLNVP